MIGPVRGDYGMLTFVSDCILLFGSKHCNQLPDSPQASL